MTDLYAVLGLSRKATSDEIKAAYWTLAKRLHPDVNAGVDSLIKEVNGAYETLGDPEQRAAYDHELACERSQARRAFWTSAATGAASFVLMVSCVSMFVMLRPNAPIHMAHLQAATVQAIALPAEPVNQAPRLGTDVASPSPVAERDVVRYAATPQDGGRRARAPALEEAGRASAGRNARRRVARVGSLHNMASGQLSARPVRRVQGNPQPLNKERLLPGGATAWQWPSADEPMVGLGARNR